MSNINLNPSQIINSVAAQSDPTLNANGSLSLTGAAPATSGVAVIIDNNVALSSGKSLSIRSGGTEQASLDWAGHLAVSRGDSHSSPGAATLNTACGQSAVAAAASSVVITNSLVTANSMVFAVINQAAADATALYVARVVPASGSFTVYVNAATTAATVINWLVVS